MMAEHIITVPMDRSMPPVMITKVIAMETSEMTAIWRVTLSRLAIVKNFGAASEKIRQSAASASRTPISFALNIDLSLFIRIVPHRIEQ